MKYIEKGCRLQDSIIWQLQERAYSQFGPDAWSQKGVPFYLTSNPSTAFKYAQLVTTFIENSNIHSDEPLYIFDLGAGTGRFAYLFLKQLHLPNIKIRYVMTDIAENNLNFLQQHPYLKPFIDAGVIDFAYYHSSQNEPLTLLKSQHILSQPLSNPIVMIANYFFDTIPQQLFRKENGLLEEARISVTLPDEIDQNDPKAISLMDYHFNYAAVSTSDPILKSYFEMIPEGSFLYPSGALKTINYFKKLSKQLFLIAGDQGLASVQQLAEGADPKISKHGTFSIPVNYHALAHYFRFQQGFGFLPSLPDPNFVVIAAGLGISELNMERAYQTNIDDFQPADYWNLINQVYEKWKDLSIEAILLLIKLGHWDPLVLNEFLPLLRSQVKSTENKQEIKIAIDKAWDHFYPINTDEGYFALNLGVLLFEIEAYEEALNYFHKALELVGPESQILKNISVCRSLINAS